MQGEINEVWKRFSELNDLKNSLFERNDDLRVEVDSFKTHFSKYEAEDFKKKLGA
jgi:regulator of replication initiation timing